MLRVFLLFFACLSLVHAADDEVLDAQFLVRTWQSEEGLPGNVVRSLGQTPDGILWVATAEGLARFDGFEFHLVTGTGAYRGQRLGFFRLITLADGSVWISTFQGGLLKVEQGELIRYLEDQNEPSPPLVTHMFHFMGSVYYLCGEKLFRMDSFQPIPVEDASPTLQQAVERTLREEERRGRTFLPVSLGRLHHRRGDSWEVVDGSLRHRTPEHPETYETVKALSRRVVVNDMLEDREGNLWLATPSQGLIRIRPSRVHRLGAGTPIIDLAIRCAIQTREGEWWIAGRGTGMDRITPNGLEHLELVKGGYDRPVTCLFQDREGDLWLASTDGSVFRWRNGQFEIPFSEETGISKVQAMAQASNGDLWFAGGRGVARWDGQTAHRYRLDPRRSITEFSTLAIGDQDQVFAGTTDGRVLELQGDHFRSLDLPKSAAGRRISAIYPATPEELWVTTIGAGLFLRKDQVWHPFGASCGLPDERLTAMVATPDQSFWFGSLGGILSASRQSLLRHLEHPSSQPRWLRLDRSDGLVTRECVGGSQPGAWVEPSGTIWFPTSSGLAGVEPAQLGLQEDPPSLQFRSVEINGSPVPVSSLQHGEITAGPGHVRLNFSYIGICLSAPEKVTYRVRLVGIDDTFQLLGNRREIAYESVPPGNYRFDVIAINGDGVSSQFPSSIRLKVLPAFWQTVWFGILCSTGLAVGAVLVGVYITRRRLRRKLETLRLKGVLERERSRISRDLHDDLGASLTELSILSALIAENPRASDIEQSVDTLSSKARNVVATLDEIVWATTPHEDSLRSLIDYLAAFAREFLDSARIHLHTDIEWKIPELAIGPRRRHNIFLATREALNNAVKHSKATEITLRIAIVGPELCIRVSDNGQGIPLHRRDSGHGLGNLRKRLNDCGGDCEFESVPGEGTCVSITLPLPFD
ncbi:sensor histidine kinase [Haloferula luteola]|uniref:sensor histidine kinase n=1 Tax=Haloferula luteola TaxID=595692 RepID=UPI001C8554CA